MSAIASSLKVMMSDGDTVATQPPRLVRKLRSFHQLAPGWSFGRGAPVTAEAIAAAERYLDIGVQLQTKTDVFANLDGGCAVAFYRGTLKVEVNISPTGTTFGLRVERGIGFDFEDVIEPNENASFIEIHRELLRLSESEQSAWKSSASWISDYSTGTGNVSGTSYTRTHRERQRLRRLRMDAGGSQSSVWSARATA